MCAHFKDNNLLIKNHYGGTRNHMTHTARAVLDNECGIIMGSNELGFVMTTHLSPAFDTVDREILV